MLSYFVILLDDNLNFISYFLIFSSLFFIFMDVNKVFLYSFLNLLSVFFIFIDIIFNLSSCFFNFNIDLMCFYYVFGFL